MTTLTPGQPIACDMTGLGHYVTGTYIGPVTVSAKHPKGGHRVRLANCKNTKVVARTPVPSDGTLTATSR
jgi:hypothetical protein